MNNQLLNQEFIASVALLIVTALTLCACAATPSITRSIPNVDLTDREAVLGAMMGRWGSEYDGMYAYELYITRTSVGVRADGAIRGSSPSPDVDFTIRGSLHAYTLHDARGFYDFNDFNKLHLEEGDPLPSHVFFVPASGRYENKRIDGVFLEYQQVAPRITVYPVISMATMPTVVIVLPSENLVGIITCFPR